jgi:hypothetical protein
MEGRHAPVHFSLGLSCHIAFSRGPRRAKYNFFATPTGDDNGVCSQAQPCSLQGALNACPFGSLCSVYLVDGVYSDPTINFYYHRTVGILGKCNDSNAVILRATKPNTTIAHLQDHATLSLNCLRMESTSTGNSGLSARQHVIFDEVNVQWGAFAGGTRIALIEYSSASCSGSSAITGDAFAHVSAADNSKYNYACAVSIPSAVNHTYFAIAADYSKIAAGSASFQGSGLSNSTGAKCHASNAIIVRPSGPSAGDFPGDQTGVGC